MKRRGQLGGAGAGLKMAPAVIAVRPSDCPTASVGWRITGLTSMVPRGR
jgi:hypothetical protein